MHEFESTTQAIQEKEKLNEESNKEILKLHQLKEDSEDKQIFFFSWGRSKALPIMR